MSTIFQDFKTNDQDKILVFCNCCTELLRNIYNSLMEFRNCSKITSSTFHLSLQDTKSPEIDTEISIENVEFKTEEESDGEECDLGDFNPNESPFENTETTYRNFSPKQEHHLPATSTERPPKRKRGRPKKFPNGKPLQNSGRGRPRKYPHSEYSRTPIGHHRFKKLKMDSAIKHKPGAVNSLSIVEGKKLKREFLCSECNEVFHSLLLYKRHLSSHEEKDETDEDEEESRSAWECPTCHSIFENESDLQKHSKDHEILYKCPVLECDKSYRKIFQLFAHLKFFHEKKLTIHCFITGCNSYFRHSIEIIPHFTRYHKDFDELTLLPVVTSQPKPPELLLACRWRFAENKGKYCENCKTRKQKCTRHEYLEEM